MSRKVLSAGATGIPARASVRKAIALGLKVRAMVRKADERSEALAGQGAEVVLGDLFDINSLRVGKVSRQLTSSIPLLRTSSPPP